MPDMAYMAGKINELRQAAATQDQLTRRGQHRSGAPFGRTICSADGEDKNAQGTRGAAVSIRWASVQLGFWDEKWVGLKARDIRF